MARKINSGIIMNKKAISMLLIVVIIVVVVVIGAAAAYYVLSIGDGNGNGGEDVITVANATSLQYDADVTSMGETIQYNWAGKNLGTEDLMIRVDLLGGEMGNFSYIMNAGEQTAWQNIVGTWEEADFAEQWASWGTAWTENLDELKADWSGTGDFTYTAENGDDITISNVSLNPELADSLFQP
jgi:hypothetical protein